jgi:hypothetical protein
MFVRSRWNTDPNYAPQFPQEKRQASIAVTSPSATLLDRLVQRLSGPRAIHQQPLPFLASAQVVSSEQLSNSQLSHVNGQPSCAAIFVELYLLLHRRSGSYAIQSQPLPFFPSVQVVSWQSGVGSDTGEDVGEVVGAGTRLVLGLAVGLPVGEDVGLAVGLPVGEDVGLAVGLPVGEEVGTVDGTAVGVVVGTLVGRDVGLAVGFPVGEDVGRELGTPTDVEGELDGSSEVVGGELDGSSEGEHVLQRVSSQPLPHVTT